jgi:hypothetical protein
MQYQEIKDYSGKVSCIKRSDGVLIPTDPDNTDYANFKKDLANGVELQDAEGNVIDGIAYLKELA